MLLAINDIRLNVHLGNTSKERASSQQVAIDISILYTANKSTDTDNLEDTVCYEQLVTALKQAAMGQEFKLIERLSKVLYEALTSIIPNPHQFNITVHKLQVPIAEILGRASFTYPKKWLIL